MDRKRPLPTSPQQLEDLLKAHALRRLEGGQSAAPKRLEGRQSAAPKRAKAKRPAKAKKR